MGLGAGLHQGLAGRGARTGVKKALRLFGLELRRIDASFYELQRDLLNKCDSLIDVGANAGQYARLVRSLGYTGSIYSFEPEASAYIALEAAAASDPRWHVEPFALADYEGHAKFHVAGNSVSSSILPMRDEHVMAAPRSAVVDVRMVKTSTLDARLSDNRANAMWLKLDVQGAEMTVLKGGSRTLERTRVVQTEMSLRPLYEGQTDYLGLASSLQRLGFTMTHVLPGFRDPNTKHLLQFDALFVRLD